MNAAMRKAHCAKGQALMRYLLDTNIVSAWARKSSSALMLKLAQTPPAAEAMTLHLLELLLSLPFGAAEARRAATLRVALGRAGQPIGPNDRLIAATALEYGLTLNHAQHARVWARGSAGRRRLARLKLAPDGQKTR